MLESPYFIKTYCCISFKKLFFAFLIMMETTVINKNYHYFIKIYNEQHIILSFYSILNTVNFNYNLYI